MKLSGHKSEVHERDAHHELEILRQEIEKGPSFQFVEFVIVAKSVCCSLRNLISYMNVGIIRLNDNVLSLDTPHFLNYRRRKHALEIMCKIRILS
jgi:hypothetical protein